MAVEVRGELSNEDVSVLSLAALRGVFSGVVEDQVTFVNATRIAEELGVDVTLTKEAESPNHRSLVTLRAVYPDGDTLTVSGTISGIAQVEKLVEVYGRSFDLRAEGVNLLLEYEDRPGVMGVVGTLLGKVGINVEAAQISQTSGGEDAVMILRVDRPVDPSVLESIGATVRATHHPHGRFRLTPPARHHLVGWPAPVIRRLPGNLHESVRARYSGRCACGSR